ncbi:uncharacterized protein LOC120537509 [Polypterus senegalus]|uniref:uncharacterized protein LOC120537509 n=1 Tax=Polypterus senegalus TaxID=55291 RepID=UPI001962D0AD|nr:uncharacterized protein LOC120537509 [Polypterus senegalus]
MAKDRKSHSEAGTGMVGVSGVPADDWMEAGLRNVNPVLKKHSMGPEEEHRRGWPADLPDCKVGQPSDNPLCLQVIRIIRKCLMELEVKANSSMKTLRQWADRLSAGDFSRIDAAGKYGMCCWVHTSEEWLSSAEAEGESWAAGGAPARAVPAMKNGRAWNPRRRHRSGKSRASNRGGALQAWRSKGLPVRVSRQRFWPSLLFLRRFEAPTCRWTYPVGNLPSWNGLLRGETLHW